MSRLYAATGLSFPRMRKFKRTIPAESEEQFLQATLVLMHLFGWKTYHTRDSRRSTPGYPDIVALRPPRGIAAELKSELGVVMSEQAEWLESYRRCGFEGYVWRPSDAPRIAELLR